ncbi:hypothetical protein ELO61_28610, partial [Klebsiella pneumoniae]|nr:hypothetical protein [Klebsiella pneumoniae]MBL3175932.1 hypothetical protein [Klebsiella pneumoniae]
LMMSLWDALRMNMMISYQELVRTFLRVKKGSRSISSSITMSRSIYSPVARAGVNRFGCTFCQQTVQANLLRLK